MRVVVLAFIVMLSVRAQAYHLDDHERVTNQAFSEFVKCFPDYQSVDVGALVAANKNEDLDFLTKELEFSHYYNPNKSLDLWWRKDSAARIENLSPALMQCRESHQLPTADEVNALGHAVHHFQDATVPAHVVPVSHAWGDGFESLAVSLDISSGWSCDQIANSTGDLETILKETALQTLKAISDLKIPVVKDSDRSPALISGKEFWVESEDSSFGHYGVYGDIFGAPEISYLDDTFRTSPDAYSLFKQQQLQLAVRATLRGLAWTLKP